MLRQPDIRKDISLMLDAIVEMYYEYDPLNEEYNENGRLETARNALEMFWRIFGELLLWAQCHVTGYCIAKDNPELVAFLEKEYQIALTEDSHLLELIGLGLVYNPVDIRDEQYEKMQNLLEGKKLLNTSTLRDIVKEMLMSRCANTSYWRFDLQTGLRALNEGEVEPIFKPAISRLRGKPASLNRWKLEALRQVCFRVGKGMKKHRALSEVGEAIGQSPETLRDWEKKFLRDEDYQNDLYCSELAGEFDLIIKKDGNLSSVENNDEYGVHRGVLNTAYALHLHPRVSSISFEEIKKNIRKFRDPKVPSGD